MPRRLRRLILLLLTGLLAGCGSTSPKLSELSVINDERFDVMSPYAYQTSVSKEKACEAARKTLLSQGYQVDLRDALTINGTKFFQPTKDHHTKLEVGLVCVDTEEGTVVYANAKQTYFELKASSNSAGLGLAGMGSISLPWSASVDNLVKVGEETVTDKSFYRRLFSLLSQGLRSGD
ncbi:hypothetical protein DLREEDagrD3_02370 [Denitratisoma sp. agr-D3]